MRKAFTLIELLVVVGIMGLLGTASVGGYRAMQRGMEERGVLQNVDTLVKVAYERAQIDRQPTAIYFWNEMVRAETQDDPAIIVGRAVAVRRQGRITRVAGGLLFDEFADLDRTYPKSASASEGGEGSGDAGDNTMYLYCLDNMNGGQLRLDRSVVLQRVEKDEQMETYMNGVPQDSTGSGKMELWGFKVENANGVSWKTGMAYGIEFSEITLPNNYVFGSSLPTSIESPVTDAGTIICGVGRSTGGGVTGSSVQGSITVNVRRPGESGSIETKQVGTNRDPSQL